MHGASSSVSRDATNVTNTRRSVGSLFTTPDGRTVDNTRWSEILIEKSDFCRTPPAFNAPARRVPVGKKTRMVWLPEGEKIAVITHFDAMHERDGQQDGQTDGHRMTASHRPRLCTASRSKNTDLLIFLLT